MIYLARAYIFEMKPDWVIVSTTVVLLDVSEMPQPRHTVHGKLQIIERYYTDEKEALQWAAYHHETYAKEPVNDDYYVSGQLTLF